MVVGVGCTKPVEVSRVPVMITSVISELSSFGVALVCACARAGPIALAKASAASTPYRLKLFMS
jgi:hypothetical protein